VEREVLPPLRELDDPRLLYDANGRYTPAVLDLKKRVRMRSAELGYYAMFAPREIGGGGFGPLAALHVYYEIARRFGAEIYPSPVRIDLIANFVNGPNAMHQFLHPAYKDRYLPALLRGEIATCFALTEPDAGSDVWMMRTRAVRRGDHWIVNGRKQWISNSTAADFAQLFAVTNEEKFRQRKGGVSCFFVSMKSPGFRIESVSPVWGHLGADEGLLSLEDVEVPAEALIGELDEGFRVMLLGVSLGRMMNSGQCIGLAEWAFRKALAYSQQRVTFGQRLCDHQAIQWMLADSAMDIYAAKSLALRVASKAEEVRSREGLLAVPAKEVAFAKAYCIETAERVIDRAIQIHGGIGFSNELKLTRAYELVRLLRVPDGSSEMQRRTIVNRLLKGDVEL
jgi:acyl-CoA dehydrogenase